MIEQLECDRLWDFSDAPASERALRNAADELERSAGDRDEVRTQVARALGLQQQYDAADALLDTIAADAPVIRVRIALERGRLRNSSGEPSAAVPLFDQAATEAQDAGLTFLAIDALHMLAIADPTRAQASTRLALELLDGADDRTQRWGIPLHNNLGWALHDEEDFDAALEQFQLALNAAEASGSTSQLIAAKWSLARCLRSLGRDAEALEIQEALHLEDPDDEYLVEELEILRRR